MKTAHYVKHGARHFLIISDTMRPVGPQVELTGKREAKAQAKVHNATPWNF